MRTPIVGSVWCYCGKWTYVVIDRERILCIEDQFAEREGSDLGKVFVHDDLYLTCRRIA